MLCLSRHRRPHLPGHAAAGIRHGDRESFNRIPLDGDTSTNDMVLCLANGVAGNRPFSVAAPTPGVFKACSMRCVGLGQNDRPRRRGRHKVRGTTSQRSPKPGRCDSRGEYHRDVKPRQDGMVWRRLQLGPDHGGHWARRVSVVEKRIAISYGNVPSCEAASAWVRRRRAGQWGSEEAGIYADCCISARAAPRLTVWTSDCHWTTSRSMRAIGPREKFYLQNISYHDNFQSLTRVISLTSKQACGRSNI